MLLTSHFEPLNMPKYRNILIVDDHPIVGAGAALYLQSVDAAIQVLHASSIAEGERLIEEAMPDLLFLDIKFDKDKTKTGIDLLRWMKDREDLAHIPVMILSGEELTRAQAEELIEQGAAGYISKGASEGPQVFRTALMNLELDAPFVYGARPNLTSTQAPPTPLGAEAFQGLQPGHRKVLNELVKGKPDKLIAKATGLTENTVRSYVRDLNRRFGVNKRGQLVYELARAGVSIGDA